MLTTCELVEGSLRASFSGGGSYALRLHNTDVEAPERSLKVDFTTLTSKRILSVSEVMQITIDTDRR